MIGNIVFTPPQTFSLNMGTRTGGFEGTQKDDLVLVDPKKIKLYNLRTPLGTFNKKICSSSESDFLSTENGLLQAGIFLSGLYHHYFQ